MAADGTILIESIRYALEGLERLAWTLLAFGVEHGRDPFHVGVFCTVCERNTPLSRSMVLRDVDPASRLLATHTDARALKVARLSENPHSSWVFYNPQRRLQVRIGGTTAAHRGADSRLARAQWEALRPNARAGYCAPYASSSVRPAPAGGLPELHDPRALSAPEAEAGFANFAVLLTRVHELEVLYLNHAGHRRARIRYADNGTATREWLAP